MRLPSYHVVEHPHEAADAWRGTEIRRDRPPRKGPGRSRDPAPPLDGRANRDHSSGLQKSGMGPMGDPGGRYAAYTARLVDGVLTNPGRTSPELRRAVLARAAGTAGQDV